MRFILVFLLLIAPVHAMERDPATGAITLSAEESAGLAQEIVAMQEANRQLYEALQAAMKKLTTCKDVTQVKKD